MTLEVRSVLERGTRFRLLVPRHHVLPEPQPAPAFCPVD
jgi:hypothetical protein